MGKAGLDAGLSYEGIEMNLRISAVVATIAVAAISLAAYDGFSLKRTLKAGDVLKYKQTGKFDIQGQQFEFEAVATEKIVKVEDNGSYVQNESTGDMKINGMEVPPGQGAPGASTTTYSPKGEITEIKTEQMDANTYRFANMALFILPENDVKAGDTWTYEVKADEKKGIVAAKAKYTFVGEEKVGKDDCLKVKSNVTETGSSPASSDGTVWIRKSDKVMVKMVAKWADVPVPNAGAISGEITLVLLP